MNNFIKVKCSVCDKEFLIEKLWLEIYKDIPNEKEYLDFKCPEFREHPKILRKREVAKIPLLTKQAVLDFIREGKTIGETKERLNLSLDAVCEIIMQNTESYSYLRSEAI